MPCIGKRSISGGEKRRVSIACELVTSPSILFLDEPTSGERWEVCKYDRDDADWHGHTGLDSYNAQSVIESLSNLARTYNRTVILTIHQPRSGIVALFDELIVLAKGRCVWAGPMKSVTAPRLVDGDEDGESEIQGVGEWLESVGRGCPVGFNIADYLSKSSSFFSPSYSSTLDFLGFCLTSLIRMSDPFLQSI